MASRGPGPICLVLVGAAVAACASGTTPPTRSIAVPSDATPSMTVPSEPPSPSPVPAASADVIEGMFDVGDKALYLECRGDGAPTVVYIHGIEGQSTDWQRTRTHTGDLNVRQCVYDQVNRGRSDDEPDRHGATESVEDLRVLLETAGVVPPYVLVGHGLGGQLALLHAGLHPDEVDGIVLVDATMPFEADLDPPGTRAAVQRELDANPARMDFYASFAEAGAVVDRLPAVPIVYLQGVNQSLPPEWQPGSYQRALESFMAGLANGRLRKLDASHHLPIEEPAVIAEEIGRVVSEIHQEGA